MNREDVLQAALSAVRHRNIAYGEPESNFVRVALLWNAYLVARRDPATPLNAADVALMCGMIKVARLCNDQGHADSWVDLAGYAACGGECV